MKNIIFNSDKTIWDTGGQQINSRRWTGASVARTKTSASGRDSGDRGTCGHRWPGVRVERPGRWWHGQWTQVARTMDAGGMENGGRRQRIVPKKKLNRVPVYKK